jgi:L-histidine N-alpha-methyltransferase
MTEPTTPRADHADADGEVVVDVLMGPTDLDDALRTDVAKGLVASPKELPPKWFYDDRGCELFDQITRLPEYYPTEAERTILRAEADAIVEQSGADTLVELGSGTSDKTRVLLDAFARAGRLRRFCPFEISETTLRAAAASIRHEYPGVAVHAVVGDFERHLGQLPQGGRRMVAFLGSTIGNFTPGERARFYTDLVSGLRPGDSLLLGTDLVKDVDRLEAAYDDAAGVTAEFNRNVLRVLNRELGASFVPERFEHDPRWDAGNEWIEMRLRATQAESVPVQALDAVVELHEGETIRTEISQKFRAERIAAELADVGLQVAETWRDGHGDFALVLAFGSE